MKRFVVEQKVNPTDDWKSYKKFDELGKAKQSCTMLNKHRCNLLKDSDYDKYRILDVVYNVYYT